MSPKARGQPLGETVPEAVSSGRARDIVGKAAGVSGRTVEKAAQVKRDGVPELVRRPVPPPIQHLIPPETQARRIDLERIKNPPPRMDQNGGG